MNKLCVMIGEYMRGSWHLIKAWAEKYLMSVVDLVASTKPRKINHPRKFLALVAWALDRSLTLIKVWLRLHAITDHGS